MGLKIGFSSSSYDNDRPIGGFSSSSYESPTKIEYINSTPNPLEFEILEISNEGTNNLAVTVKYPSVSNYEGVKILIYKNLTEGEFRSFKSIDPHFCNNVKFKSPYVRFEPTQQGWEDALILLKLI
jgi:hypothetical protein